MRGEMAAVSNALPGFSFSNAFCLAISFRSLRVILQYRNPHNTAKVLTRYTSTSVMVSVQPATPEKLRPRNHSFKLRYVALECILKVLPERARPRAQQASNWRTSRNILSRWHGRKL